MRNANDKILSGNLWGGIFKYSLPLIFTYFFQMLFNMCDVAVIGKYSGAESLGAVGCTNMLVSLFTSLLIGVSSGVVVYVSRYFGSRKEDKISRTIHTAFLLAIFFGLIVLLIGIFGSNGMLRLIKTKDELIDKATLYLTIYFIGMPGLSLYNYGNAVYSALGETKKPLIFLLCSGLLNVVLNLFFVIVLKMDVAGVALASAISQYLAGILVIISLRTMKKPYRLSIKNMCFDVTIAKNVLYIGIPTGLQSAVFAIANLFIQSGVNSLDTVYVEANAAAANADTFTWSLMDAFYVACSSFISANIGAKNYDRVKKTYYITTVYSFVIGVIVGVLLIVFRRQFLFIFTNESSVVDAGVGRLIVMACSYWVSAIMDNTIAACRGLGKTIYPTICVMFWSCVFRVIWMYFIFPLFGSITSIYLVYFVSWVLTSIMVVPYFFVQYKKIVNK